jgi:hypothetical protein
MNVPPGRLVRSRVRCDTATVLREALDTSLTGYATLEPRDALLGSGGRGVLVFIDGVPTLAYHPESGAGGPAALAKLGAPGPCRAELHAVPEPDLPDPEADPSLRVSPGVPAERLAGAPELAARARRLASEDVTDGDSAVLSFLDDDRKVEAIRENASEEAERRAEEWGFDDAL